MDSELQALRVKPCVSAFGPVRDEDIFFSPGTSSGKVASPSLKAAVSHIFPIQRTKVLKIDLHLSELEVISPANKAD